MSCGFVTEPAAWTRRAVKWSEPPTLPHGDCSLSGLYCLGRLLRLDRCGDIPRNDDPSALLFMRRSVLTTVKGRFCGWRLVRFLDYRSRPQLPPRVRVTTTNLGWRGLVSFGVIVSAFVIRAFAIGVVVLVVRTNTGSLLRLIDGGLSGFGLGRVPGFGLVVVRRCFQEGVT